MYHEGMDLVAVVSTGADVWSLKVRGQLVNETWNNIGVNWSPYKNDTDLPYSERGGLEVKIRRSLIFLFHFNLPALLYSKSHCLLKLRNNVTFRQD